MRSTDKKDLMPAPQQSTFSELYPKYKQNIEESQYPAHFKEVKAGKQYNMINICVREGDP